MYPQVQYIFPKFSFFLHHSKLLIRSSAELIPPTQLERDPS